MGRWDAGWRGVLSGLAPGGGRGYIAFARLTGPGRHQRADWVPGLERRRVRHHRRRARLPTTPGMRRGPDQRVRGVGGHRSWPMATKQCLDAHDGRRTRISGRSAAADPAIQPRRLRFSRCARVTLDAFAQLPPRLEPGRVPRGKRHRRPGPGACPIRARRRRSEKLPMPRISMRPPRARHRAIWSSIVFIASSMSRSTSCEFFRAMR